MIRKNYRTRRLVIRPYRTADYEAWASGHQNLLPKQYFYDWVPPKNWNATPALFRKVILRQQRKAKEGRHFVYPVFLRQSGEWVGVMDVFVIDRTVLQVANLGYRFNNTFQRRGFATEALLKFIPGVLRDLKLNRLEAVIDPDNKPSVKLVRKVGLRREGIRQSYYYQNRGWADQVVYVADRKMARLPMLHPRER